MRGSLVARVGRLSRFIPSAAHGRLIHAIIRSTLTPGDRVSVQAQTRRKRLLLGSATALAAVGGMTGDLIFTELKDEWALGAFGGAAAVVAGLTAFLYRHSADDLAVSVRAGLEEPHQLPRKNYWWGGKRSAAASSSGSGTCRPRRAAHCPRTRPPGSVP